MSDQQKPQDAYDLHIGEILTLLRKWMIPTLFVAAIGATLAGVWIFHTTAGAWWFARLVAALSAAEMAGVAILAVPYTLQALYLQFVKEESIKKRVRRFNELQHDEATLIALDKEAGVERSDGQNWTLLPFFVLSVLLAGLSYILQLTLIQGGIWITMGLIVFLGVVQRVGETAAANILARALIRYELQQAQAKARAKPATTALADTTDALTANHIPLQDDASRVRQNGTSH